MKCSGAEGLNSFGFRQINRMESGFAGIAVALPYAYLAKHSEKIGFGLGCVRNVCSSWHEKERLVQKDEQQWHRLLASVPRKRRSKPGYNLEGFALSRPLPPRPERLAAVLAGTSLSNQAGYEMVGAVPPLHHLLQDRATFNEETSLQF